MPKSLQSPTGAERCSEVDTQDRECLLPKGHEGQHGFYGKPAPSNAASTKALTNAMTQTITYAAPTGLDAWWHETDLADWEAFGPKLKEYGARDLVAHGRAITDMAGHGNYTDAELGEIGCMFYLHGKLARAMEAYVGGRVPSADTLKDIETYARMARAFRERGGLNND